MKKLFLGVICAMMAIGAFAQGEFKFEEESYDFGQITEGDKAEHVFKFKNVGNEPIMISNVRASCGCTTPSWPREPIPPGGESHIKAIYNSKNRPGGFHKSITITSNAKSPTKVVRIKGNAEKAPARVYTDAEKANSPHIRFAKNDHNFGNVELGKSVTKKFTISNTGKSDLMIKNMKSSCNCISFRAEKPTLKPGESGSVSVTYRPKAVGMQKEQVRVITNDIVTPETLILIRGNVSSDHGNKSIIRSNDQLTF